MFTDDSGRRAHRLEWVTRTLVTAVTVLALGVALTLGTHVPIPPLPGLLPTETATDRQPDETVTARAGAAGNRRASPPPPIDAGMLASAAGTGQEAAFPASVDRSARPRTAPAARRGGSATTPVFAGGRTSSRKPAVLAASPSRRPLAPPGQVKKHQGATVPRGRQPRAETTPPTKPPKRRAGGHDEMDRAR